MRNCSSKAALALGFAASLIFCAAANAKRPVSCESLAFQFKAKDVVLSSSTLVWATSTDPEHCDVVGVIRGNINLELFLPTDWNGRFQMVGNGGKAGTISTGDMRTALRLGYAAASTDTGHNLANSGPGGQFGVDPEKEIDFGWRAVHLTAQTSKDIVKAFYGAKPHHSYWVGCSTGGRQGLMEAQRFPKDFDGYVTGAPVNDYTGQQMTAPAYLPPLYSSIPGTPLVTRALIGRVGNVVYNGNGLTGPNAFAGCDALDGVVDHQLRDPRACTFDPQVHIPTCPDTTSSGLCLTGAQKDALSAIYAGRPPFVPPQILGAEDIPGGWTTWVIGNDAGSPPLLHSVIADAFEWLMFNPDRPGFNYLTEFDWNVDPFQMGEAARIFNATDPDLRDVKARGGKIIMYHGWGDPGANPLRTVAYYESVIGFMGRHSGPKSMAAENTSRFFKLYMVPGMAHCGGGTGHSNVDWLTPLVDWVENGVAPQAIVGTRASDGSTRPHCPYPQAAMHDGAGAPADAASYRCGTP
jgi:feruloyl esterase